ncbi:MAG: RDD family protein [Chloroflexota bacterium]
MNKMKVGMGYELGDVGERFIAIAIDGIILGLITGLLFGAGGEAGGGLGLVVGVLYNWYFWTRQDGQTPGKRMMGLRVIKADGSQLSDVDALIRALGYYVSGLVFSLGYIWALFDDQSRTWHDIMAGTRVVKA